MGWRLSWNVSYSFIGSSSCLDIWFRCCGVGEDDSCCSLICTRVLEDLLFVKFPDWMNLFSYVYFGFWAWYWCANSTELSSFIIYLIIDNCDGGWSFRAFTGLISIALSVSSLSSCTLLVEDSWLISACRLQYSRHYVVEVEQIS